MNLKRCFRCNVVKNCFVFFLRDCFSIKLGIADGYLCLTCYEVIKRRILRMDYRMTVWILWMPFSSFHKQRGRVHGEKDFFVKSFVFKVIIVSNPISECVFWALSVRNSSQSHWYQGPLLAVDGTECVIDMFRRQCLIWVKRCNLYFLGIGI